MLTAPAPSLVRAARHRPVSGTQAHRHVTASASLLHSWDDKGNSVPFTLNVLNLGDTDVEVDET